MLYIENSTLKIGIKTFGGTLGSVIDKRNNEELLWQGDEKSWTGQDVVIFPFVARLKDGKYTVDGKTFEMGLHGILISSEFYVIEHSDKKLILGSDYSAETLKHYPYRYNFRLTYELNNYQLTTKYEVINKDDKVMYFGLGGHPAYKLDAQEYGDRTDTDGNYIEFEKEQNLDCYTLSGSFIKGIEPFGKTKKISLNKDIFVKYDTIMLKNVDGGIKIVKKSGREIKFLIHKPPVLAFWSCPDFGAYVCIEPWHGIPDNANPERELKDKELINSLEPSKTFEYRFETIY